MKLFSCSISRSWESLDRDLPIEYFHFPHDRDFISSRSSIAVAMLLFFDASCVFIFWLLRNVRAPFRDASTCAPHGYVCVSMYPPHILVPSGCIYILVYTLAYPRAPRPVRGTRAPLTWTCAECCAQITFLAADRNSSTTVLDIRLRRKK